MGRTLPTYTSTVQKCVEEDGKVVFQCQDLKNFSLAKSYYANHYKEYCSKVVECIKSRLSWSDMQQLREREDSETESIRKKAIPEEGWNRYKYIK